MIHNKHKDIIVKQSSLDVFNDIIKRWNEPHRFYHNIEHLTFILSEIENLYQNKVISESEYRALIVVAFYHDVIYNPRENNNEEKSVEYFVNNNKNGFTSFSSTVVSDIIMETKNRNKPTEKLAEIFWNIDNRIITQPISNLIEYEHKIFKEYQWVAYDKYKEGRIDFLNSCVGLFDEKTDENIYQLINYVNDRKIHIGVYAGSFNPIHIGHMNIIKKSKPMFDKIIVAFGNNPDKEESVKEFPKSLDYIQCLEYKGLVTDLLDEIEKDNVTVTLIRGIRNGIDLSYESNQISFINDIRPNTNVIYIPADKEFEHISSSAIRNLMKFDQEQAKKYLI